jgi:hypothetical protein
VGSRAEIEIAEPAEGQVFCPSVHYLGCVSKWSYKVNLHIRLFISITNRVYEPVYKPVSNSSNKHANANKSISHTAPAADKQTNNNDGYADYD